MSTKTYTRWATRTGEIIDILSMPEESFDYHNTTLTEGSFDGSTHYFLNGQPTERPVQSTSVDTTEISVSIGTVATLSGLPDPCRVTIYSTDTGSNAIDVAGGTLEFSAAIQGTYTLTVDAFPHVPWETTIHAV